MDDEGDFRPGLKAIKEMGEIITREKLEMIGKGEELLVNLGFKQMRVRVHGTIARIELLPEDFEKFMQNEIRTEVVKEFKNLGFTYITLDLEGFRSGSMNLPSSVK